MGAMDWIRRNWPDLLIGVALVLVIAMIIATLLSGGSLLSLVRRDTPPEPQAVTTLGPEPITEPEPVAADDAPDEGAGEGAEAEGDAPEPTAEAATIDPFIPEVGDAQTGGAPLLAGADDDDDEVAEQDAEAEADGGEEATAAAADAPPAPASPTGSYRVAAGAVGSREGADELAQSYRELGYTVAVEEQGDLFLLWVGPYDNAEDAEAAAQGIRDAGGDALVYRFAGAAADAEGGAAAAAETAEDAAENTDENTVAETSPAVAGEEAATGADVAAAEGDVVADATDDAETAAAGAGEAGAGDVGAQGAATADTGTAAADAATEETETAETADAPGTEVGAGSAVQEVAPPSAPAGQRYLQVGAFASPESAEGLHQRLEDLGFDVTRSETETGLTRLYVGPFDADELSQTQATLTAQGIDSFPVAQ